MKACYVVVDYTKGCSISVYLDNFGNGWKLLEMTGNFWKTRYNVNEKEPKICYNHYQLE